MSTEMDRPTNPRGGHAENTGRDPALVVGVTAGMLRWFRIPVSQEVPDKAVFDGVFWCWFAFGSEFHRIPAGQ